MHNITSSVGPVDSEQQVVNNALEEYSSTAAEYGHYSVEAIIAKLRWQSLKKSMAATSVTAPYPHR